MWVLHTHACGVRSIFNWPKCICVCVLSFVNGTPIATTFSLALGKWPSFRKDQKRPSTYTYAYIQRNHISSFAPFTLECERGEWKCSRLPCGKNTWNREHRDEGTDLSELSMKMVTLLYRMIYIMLVLYCTEWNTQFWCNMVPSFINSQNTQWKDQKVRLHSLKYVASCD